MIWAPKARGVLLEFFARLAARDAAAAESLRERLDGALRRIEVGAMLHITLVLPDGRVVYRVSVPPLTVTYERGPRDVVILQVTTAT